MHASWNLLARYDRSEGAFYLKMLVAIIVIGLIPAVYSEVQTRSLTPLAWACVVGSGISAGVYLYALARAFASSDFTIVYPVARSLPVIFVALIDVARGVTITPLGWLGIFLVAIGCILVPLNSFQNITADKYFNQATMWMFLAALGTVGYTFLDKIAAEVVQSGPATAARYGIFYFTISIIPLYFLLKLAGGKAVGKQKTNWKLAIPAGILSFAAYWLILWAYQLSPSAGYIVAFRQFSIVIGATLAFVIYKESGVGIRLIGAALITAGLILIGGWGR